MLDLCFEDEAGFAMTLPPCYSWSPMGEPVCVAYEASQGRRVNTLGALFSHGPQAGRFDFEVYASLPKNKARKRRLTVEQVAAAHGLTAAEVGPITAERFLAFVWRVAGRPPVYLSGWKRERPLVMVVDNYSVHVSQLVKEVLPELAAADISLFYLPPYSPELSDIEPVWQSVKHHEMPKRSFEAVRDLKRSVEEALARKADALRQSEPILAPSLRAITQTLRTTKTTNLLRMAA